MKQKDEKQQIPLEFEAGNENAERKDNRPRSRVAPKSILLLIPLLCLCWAIPRGWCVDGFGEWMRTAAAAATGGFVSGTSTDTTDTTSTNTTTTITTTTSTTTSTTTTTTTSSTTTCTPCPDPPEPAWSTHTGITPGTVLRNGQPLTSRVFYAGVGNYTLDQWLGWMGIGPTGGSDVDRYRWYWYEQDLETCDCDLKYDQVFPGDGVSAIRSGNVDFTTPGVYEVSWEWDDTPNHEDADDDPAGDEKITIKVYRVTPVSKVKFTSDHGVLQDYNTDYSGSGAAFPEPEWVAGGVNAPITQTRSTSIKADVSLKIEPAGLPFILYGEDGTAAQQFDFEKGATSTGGVQEVAVTGKAALPNAIGTLSASVGWSVKFTEPDPDVTAGAGNSGAHKVYILFGAPAGSAPTEKRISWAVGAANGADTAEELADGIHAALAGDPPFEPSEKPLQEGARWQLLDGAVSGECDEQAGLMEYAVKILGGTAEVKLVYATTNAGAGNCLDHESRMCPVHGFEFLQMDFPGINQFEGCCVTAGHYYAVWPNLKATNDYTMLKDKLKCGQVYCHGTWTKCNQPGAVVPIP